MRFKPRPPTDKAATVVIARNDKRRPMFDHRTA